MLKVAILGCGPAGLLAAHAVFQSGHLPVIYSKKEQSKLMGAQFSHIDVPGVTTIQPDTIVTYRSEGTAEEYRNKVYGPMYDGSVSFEVDGATQGAWNLRTVYDHLWARYHRMIVPLSITPDTVRDMTNEHGLVLNTIPLPVICKYPHDHQFDSRPVWVIPREARWVPNNTIMYDGRPDSKWYRISKLFGVAMTEFPMREGQELPGEGTVLQKPISTTCSCWLDSVVRLGRYGAWTKGVLTSDAFRGTLSVMRRYAYR